MFLDGGVHYSYRVERTPCLINHPVSDNRPRSLAKTDNKPSETEEIF